MEYPVRHLDWANSNAVPAAAPITAPMITGFPDDFPSAAGENLRTGKLWTRVWAAAREAKVGAAVSKAARASVLMRLGIGRGIYTRVQTAGADGGATRKLACGQPEPEDTCRSPYALSAAADLAWSEGAGIVFDDAIAMALAAELPS